MDRARCDPSFKIPAGLDYDPDFLTSRGDPSARIHGWELETLLTELLAVPRRSGRRKANAASWALMRELVNALRDAENEEYASTPGRQNIFREIARIGYRQFRWQTHPWNAADAVRWWSVFENPQLRSIFQERVGVDLVRFVRAGMMWNYIFNSQHQTVKPSANTEWISATDLEAVIKSSSMSLDEVADVSRRIISEAESIAYRKGPLRNRPLINIGTEGAPLFLRPLEHLLAWRLTSGLYYDVIDHPDAPNLIGLEFERHTRSLLGQVFKESCVEPEISYGTRKAPKRGPDITLRDGGCIIAAIECKAKRLPLVARTALNAPIERTRAINEIAKGVVQLCRFQCDVQDHVVGLEALAMAPKAPLVVVCLDDWIFVGPDVKEDVFRIASTLAADIGIPRARIGKRDIVLCTASELDTVVSSYPPDVVLQILSASVEDEFREHTIDGVATARFSDFKRSNPVYPLKAELDRLLGIVHHNADSEPLGVA